MKLKRFIVPIVIIVLALIVWFPTIRATAQSVADLLYNPGIKGTMYFYEGSWFKPSSAKIAGTDSIGGTRDTVLVPAIDANDLVFIVAVKGSTFIAPPNTISKADTFIVLSDSTEAAEYGYFIIAQ